MVQADIEARVLRAMDQLPREDSYLIKRDANERSITHRLAIHLAAEFPDSDVDCEYNRDGHEPKRLSLPKRTDITSEDEHATTVFPDIIMHRRGTNEDNLLVIEVKKKTNPDRGDWDRTKLKAFTDPDQLGYKVGAFILLETGPTENAAELEFVGGRTIRRSRSST